MAKVYLLFTRSNSVMSKMIHQLTQDEYTHVSISIDQDLQAFYSFARRYSYAPLPAGFTKESVFEGFYSRFDHLPCKLCAIDVDHQTYLDIAQILEHYYENKEKYKYDILGTIFCKMGKVYPRENHRFCSHFVSEILLEHDLLAYSLNPGLVRPVQLVTLLEEQTVFEGELWQLRNWIQNRHQFYDFHTVIA